MEVYTEEDSYCRHDPPLHLRYPHVHYSQERDHSCHLDAPVSSDIQRRRQAPDSSPLAARMAAQFSS